jgi:hypothetical protein
MLIINVSYQGKPYLWWTFFVSTLATGWAWSLGLKGLGTPSAPGIWPYVLAAAAWVLCIGLLKYGHDMLADSIAKFLSWLMLVVIAAGFVCCCLRFLFAHVHL